MIVTLPHPKAGNLRVLGVPVRLHATPGKAATAPPLLGQHTERVLRTVLGVGKGEVARLRKSGVV
jgi:crotonobetainyl-CoA:carnitine CoA-transferase CaiB-like acyl-CoA transferase